MKKSDVKTIRDYVFMVFENILDFIWPQFCLACQKEGSICCGLCLNNIILKYDFEIKWPDKQKLYFDNCYVCCDYNQKLVQKLIKTYKYNYLENIADKLTDVLEKQSRRLLIDKNTIILNIPLHPTKKRQRGFDQTELLAKKLAKRLNLNYYPLLQRIKNNQAQAKLNKKDRQKNVANIFELNKKIAKNITSYKKILLIDDVTTTGATLNSAAKILRQNNFENIDCLVLAKN